MPATMPRFLLPTLALLGMMLAAAAGPAPRGATPAAPRVWPAAPAQARVAFVRSVSGGADVGITRGWLGRLSDSLTGRRDVHFLRPTSAVEADGALYVADPGARQLVILDAARNRVVIVGRVGETALVSPVAVAPGPGDSVLVVDSQQRHVYQIGRDGRSTRVLVRDGLARPAGIAFDAARGRFYVTDSLAHRVYAYATDGRRVADWGGQGADDGRFNSPTHVAVAPDGRVYVTDALNFRVQVFEPDGRFAGRFGRHGDGAGNFAAPKGVGVDRKGQVYVADALFDAVQIFQPDGQLLLGIGSQGSGPGQFWLPNGVFVGADGRLLVADAYNRRIQVFQVLPDAADGGGGR